MNPLKRKKLFRLKAKQEILKKSETAAGPIVAEVVKQPEPVVVEVVAEVQPEVKAVEPVAAVEEAILAPAPVATSKKKKSV